MIQNPSTVDLDTEMIRKIPKRSRVIEFACASGSTAFKLEKMGFDVTAFDIDPEAVLYCKEKAKRIGSRVNFLEADGTSLPFEDESFDACIMNAFMTMMDSEISRRRGADEGCRILKSGGFLYIADFLQNWDHPVYRRRYEEHFKITGDLGTFIATEDGSIDGREIYRAHHYTYEGLTSLFHQKLEPINEKRGQFTTYHGNRIEGIEMLLRKS